MLLYDLPTRLGCCAAYYGTPVHISRTVASLTVALILADGKMELDWSVYTTFNTF